MENIRLTNQYGGTFVYCPKHIDAHRKHLLGNVVETKSNDPCPDCIQEEKYNNAPAVMEAALANPRCVHTRYRNGSVYAYFRDNTSPSGVLLACTLDEERFDEVYARLIKEGRISSSKSPLSPTEMRGV